MALHIHLNIFAFQVYFFFFFSSRLFFLAQADGDTVEHLMSLVDATPLAKKQLADGAAIPQDSKSSRDQVSLAYPLFCCLDWSCCFIIVNKYVAASVSRFSWYCLELKRCVLYFCDVL
jgi:hypothetical protein